MPYQEHYGVGLAGFLPEPVAQETVYGYGAGIVESGQYESSYHGATHDGAKEVEDVGEVCVETQFRRPYEGARGNGRSGGGHGY